MKISEFKGALITKVLNDTHFLEMDLISYIERIDISYSERVDLCLNCLIKIKEKEDLLEMINNKFHKLFLEGGEND